MLHLMLRAVAPFVLLWALAPFCGGSACPHARAQTQARFTEEADEVGAVLSLLRERLALMPAVAAYKWQHQLPVLDAAREESLLTQTAEQAERLGLDASSVRALFSLQLRLARSLQERTIARLTERGLEGTKVLDLAAALRPKLDRIGQQLLETLARAEPTLQAPGLAARYTEEAARTLGPVGLSAEEAGALMHALGQLRASSMPLKQRVLARSLLRVGTTGDYAPFSLEQRRGLRGADVELVQTFARSLGVSVRFVRTRWSTLMQDYARGAFDIAASGISVTPERSAVARFSLPYHHGGKTAIARCKDRATLDTLAEIDQPSVRVIVNPGGTNEAFARGQLQHAQLTLFPDNRTIFEEIVQGRADVMVTDDVEVALQTRLHRQLCRTSRELFAPGDKAWLLPPDAALAALVEDWLTTQIQEGKTAAALSRALLLAPDTARK